jgi:hypothetical protein
MRWVLGVCVLLVLLALGASASAADPPVPVYLRAGYGPGGEFAVLSNGDWKVKTTRLVKPRLVSVSRKGRPDDTLPRDRQDLSYVWAPTCSARSQVVSFVRDVVLPGPPGEMGFEWDWTGGPFESASLYVNREEAYTSKATGRTRIEHDKSIKLTRLFRDGVNHLEVRVKKKAIPPGFPKVCNTGNPSRNAGVRFLVEGKFAADVAVRTDIPATEVKRVGYQAPVSGAIDIVNNGPSTVYWGRFKFVITAAAESMLFVDGPTASGAGISACRSTAAPKTFATSVTIECDLRNMRSEAKAVVSFNLIVSIVRAASARSDTTARWCPPPMIPTRRTTCTRTRSCCARTTRRIQPAPRAPRLPRADPGRSPRVRGSDGARWRAGPDARRPTSGGST